MRGNRADDAIKVVGLALRGTFQNCGQNCIGLERVVALKGVYDRLVDVMSTKINALTQVGACACFL